MNNNIYFDVAATTPIDLKVLEVMSDINSNYFGNPSSIHQFGQKAHNLLEKNRKKIAEKMSIRQPTRSRKIFRANRNSNGDWICD